jgi:hypothetical protein
LVFSTLPTLAAQPEPAPVESSAPSAVSTFVCLSLYWSPPSGSSENTCSASYREKGSPDWHEALPLWYDARNQEYRGSIVSLKPGTAYEVKLRLEQSATETVLEAVTWAETAPIAKVIRLPADTRSAPLVISEGGSPDGYVLYEGAPDLQSHIDVANNAPSCVQINAPYVIVRGLKLSGAQKDAIYLGKAAHDVRIESCDISGWGRIAADGWGKNLDSGIRADAPEVYRIVIQGNRIHHPRSNSNDWTQPRTITGEKLSAHPNGPQGIMFINSKGNNVIRFNEVTSDEEHRFNDGIGGGANFSAEGFPGPDSDVYGNIVRNSIDDALEIEGGSRNVRIWSNYLDTTFTGVATASCSVGPLYVFRNVLGLTRSHSGPSDGADNTGAFGKLGNNRGFGDGRVYYFHNTLLQPKPKGATRPLGAAWALADWGGRMTQTVSRNNIWQTVAGLEQVVIASMGNHSKNPFSVIDHKYSPTNDLDYDLLSNLPDVASGNYTHAIHALPVFADTNPRDSLNFGLAPSSPGFDGGVIIPNFNDGFSGKSPDIGAQETAAEPLLFGIPAYAHEVHAEPVK